MTKKLKILAIFLLFATVSHQLDTSTFKVVTVDLEVPEEFEVCFPEPASNKTSRILNGSNAANGQFPFAAFLHVTRPTGTFYCTGSLIASNWILTSRSCFVNVRNEPATRLQAFVGSNDNQSPALQSAIAAWGGWIDDSAGNHPNFAIFRLNLFFPTTNLIRPVRLPRWSQENFGFDDFNVTTVGWGRLINNAFPRILQFGNFRILAHHLCFWNPNFSAHNFCSQHQSLGAMVSIERGEGGASVITENDGQMTLVGVTSVTFGLPNGVAAANVRISSFLRFIVDSTGIQLRP